VRFGITNGIRRAVVAVALASLATTGLAACGGDDDKGSTVPPAGAGADGVDDGSQLTLWTRAPLELQAKALVTAYNASHRNQVALTIVPNDDYVSKVGAAAGSGDLPDLFAADIVYVPNWAKAGLFADPTDSIAKLPYADKINQAHRLAELRG
jgi:multiple sugar transport system substrate-binding protein